MPMGHICWLIQKRERAKTKCGIPLWIPGIKFLVYFISWSKVSKTTTPKHEIAFAFASINAVSLLNIFWCTRNTYPKNIGARLTCRSVPAAATYSSALEAIHEHPSGVVWPPWCTPIGSEAYCSCYDDTRCSRGKPASAPAFVPEWGILCCCSVALSLVESGGQGPSGMLSHDDLFYFFGFSLSIY